MSRSRERGRMDEGDTYIDAFALGAPLTFLGLFTGRNTGKMLVRLADPE